MSQSTTVCEELAVHNGTKAVQREAGDMFTWPIITREDEEAALEVLRRGAMSLTDVTMKLEEEIAAWHGVKYALAHNTGTASLHAAMWACGVGVGDEIIGPSITYWASVTQALSLGATVVFADVDLNTLCIDPKDLENRITDKTKAIVVVHYCGHPCDMDAILEITRPRGIKVIEDVSHAHGALYKGRLVGTIGDVAGMSVMSGKALAIGEGGVLLTDDPKIYQRAIAFGHYERTGKTQYAENAGLAFNSDLQRFAGIPLAGQKFRMHQLSSAVGRVQLKHYKRRMAEMQSAMNRFWDLLEGEPGIRAHRPPKESGSTMGGWYFPHGLYIPDELGGLPLSRFAEAVRAEGSQCNPGANSPLHLHAVFSEADVYGHGCPTNVANNPGRAGRKQPSLPSSELVPERCFSIPWFKHDRPEIIEEHAEAFRKVARAAREGLLK